MGVTRRSKRSATRPRVRVRISRPFVAGGTRRSRQRRHRRPRPGRGRPPPPPPGGGGGGGGGPTAPRGGPPGGEGGTHEGEPSAKRSRVGGKATNIKAEDVDSEAVERCKTIRESLKRQLADVQKKQLDLAAVFHQLSKLPIDKQNPVIKAALAQITSTGPAVTHPRMVYYTSHHHGLCINFSHHQLLAGSS